MEVNATLSEKEKGTMQAFYQKMFTGTKLVFKIIMISPVMAQKLLDEAIANHVNRRIRRAVVEKIKRQIIRGAWFLHGETVIMCESGFLIDGQHRLLAIIETGLTIPVAMALGAPDPSFKVIDSGTKRGNSDVLYIEGEKYPDLTASTISLLTAIESGSSLSCYGSPDQDIQEKFLAANPNVRYSVSFCKSKQSSEIGLTPTWLASSHYLFSKENQKVADDFMEKLIFGVRLQKHHKIYKLRRRLSSMKKKDVKITTKVALDILTSAWKEFPKSRV